MSKNELLTPLRRYLLDLFSATNSQNNKVFDSPFPIRSIYNPSKTTIPDYFLGIGEIQLVIGVYKQDSNKSLPRRVLDPIFSYLEHQLAKIGVLFIYNNSITDITYTTGHLGSLSMIQSFPLSWKRTLRIFLTYEEIKIIKKYYDYHQDIRFRSLINEIDNLTPKIHEKITSFLIKIKTSMGPLIIDPNRNYIIEHFKLVAKNLPGMDLLHEDFLFLLQFCDDKCLQELYNSLQTYNQVGEIRRDFVSKQSNALLNLAVCAENFVKTVLQKTFIFAPVFTVKPLNTLNSCYFSNVTKKIRKAYPLLIKSGQIKKVRKNYVISIFGIKTWFSEFQYIISKYGHFRQGSEEDVCNKLDILQRNDLSLDKKFVSIFGKSETNILIQRMTISLLIRNWLSHEPNKECILISPISIKEYYNSILSIFIIFYKETKNLFDPNLLF